MHDSSQPLGEWQRIRLTSMFNYLFDPASIAVVGASRNPKKVGYSVVNNLKMAGFEGKVFPVNPSSSEILGFKTYPRMSEVDDSVDLAIIAVPSKFVAETLIDGAKAGLKAAVIITAGFKECGAEGRKLEEQLKEVARKYDIRILGPNCLGIINTSNNMNASFAPGAPRKGRTALFSQSGALGVAILDWAESHNFGFSKFISLGNKADMNESDFIEYLIDDGDTDVILGYIEDVVDGRRFLEVSKRATRVKPMILLKSGSTKAGERAASSHTGALAGSDIAFTSAFKQTGIMRAEGVQEFFEMAHAFDSGKLPGGDGLLIITNAGGPGIIAADTAERVGLRLPLLTRESLQTLAEVLPPTASLYNPVDVIGDASAERYKVALDQAIGDPNVDGIVVLLTPQAVTEVEKTAEVIINCAALTEKPIITSFMGGNKVNETLRVLKGQHVPSYEYAETAVKAFRWISKHSSWKKREEEPEFTVSFDKKRIQTSIDRFIEAGKLEVGESDAMSILAPYGFDFPKRALANTPRQASKMASDIGFPVVMKVSSPDVLHKTDVGAVKMNINSPQDAEDAFIEITTNVYRLVPDAYIEGIMIYEMVRGGKEVILGVTYDRTFGHMIMFGLGGIYVEVLKDVSFRIAPVSYAEATDMIREVKTSAVLMGARGEKPLDISVLTDSIVRLSHLATDFPMIHEMDINPLKVLEKGAVALDSRIIFRNPRES